MCVAATCKRRRRQMRRDPRYKSRAGRFVKVPQPMTRKKG